MTGLAYAEGFLDRSLGLLWQHRLVVVFGDQATYEAQRAQMLDAAYDWRDRDLILIGVSDAAVFAVDHQGQLSTAQVSAIQTIDAKSLGDRYPGPVALIGKDGGVKLRQDQPIPNAELFNTIDVMPMRRREMRAD